MADHDQRLALLEEGLYFQEKLLKDLDEALQEQQKSITQLERALARAEEKIANLTAQQEGGFVQTVPPHSVKW